MNKKTILIILILIIGTLLFGCTQTSTCGDGICQKTENINNCPQDCNQPLIDTNTPNFDKELEQIEDFLKTLENNTAKPPAITAKATSTINLNQQENLQGTRRFAIENVVPELIDETIDLNTGLAELQGLPVNVWGPLQQIAPINGVATYTPLNDLDDWTKRLMNSIKQSDMELSMGLDLYGADWAITRSDDIIVISPRSGEEMYAFTGIKPEHLQDYKNFVKYYLETNLEYNPNFKYIQIDNEPDNFWASGPGYVETLKTAYEAVQEYNQEHQTDIKVMAAGFNMGEALTTFPEHLQTYALENYPDINTTYVKEELTKEFGEYVNGFLISDLSDWKIKQMSQKLHIFLSVLNSEEQLFDILTLHLDDSRVYDRLDEIIPHYKSIIGEEKPIWVDDGHVNYHLEHGLNLGIREEVELNIGIINNDPTTLQYFEKIQSAWMLRKVAGYFSSGLDRVKLKGILDLGDPIPYWRVAELFEEDLKPYPAYYTAKLMIEKLDYFTTAKRIGEEYLYKFEFENKDPVFIAWSEKNENLTKKYPRSGIDPNTILETIDLSNELGTNQAKITYLTNEVNLRHQPITRENKIVPSNQIPLTEEPIFIEPHKTPTLTEHCTNQPNEIKCKKLNNAQNAITTIKTKLNTLNQDTNDLQAQNEINNSLNILTELETMINELTISEINKDTINYAKEKLNELKTSLNTLKKILQNPTPPITTEEPEKPQGKQRFAIDGESGTIETLNDVVLLNDGLSELQGTGIVIWGAIQPTAPVNGVATYTNINDPEAKQYKEFFKEYQKTNRELSAVIEFYNNDWALEYHPDINVISPKTAKQIPGFVRIKPEYEQAWKDFIKYYISIIPNLKYIQTENEPENVWVSGEGYYRTLELAYEAVQEYNIEHGTNIQVMAAGFYMGDMTLKMPQSIQDHALNYYPDINTTFVREELTKEYGDQYQGINISDIPDKYINYRMQKLHVYLTVLKRKNPSFDILTIHQDYAGGDLNKIDSIIESHKKIMRENGYDRPIWMDDMHSGYYPNLRAEPGTFDYQLYQGLDSGDQTIIQQYTKQQPTWLVKKAANNFAAGFERVKISYLHDTPDYNLPVWKYVGLFTHENKRKPSYYTAKIMIEKLDYFETATKINLNQEDYLYKFTFADKDDIFVAWTEPQKQNESYWSDQTIKTIDLSNYIKSETVEITHLVNEINLRNQPITKPNQKVPTTQVPLSSQPIFITTK
jgi:hypothetical protein